MVVVMVFAAAAAVDGCGGSSRECPNVSRRSPS